ncbi:hypothetical protein Nepgr_010678 [Nepenthes gracilis]|uniref:Uncharacterized protein n=1 Tax=Nepenthes gracilis TaxID=150966 RepID=A0AAD3SCU5_NEPGR|nr:hypothetical protein Nepgr_010678 [Nepenthes gracilis]
MAARDTGEHDATIAQATESAASILYISRERQITHEGLERVRRAETGGGILPTPRASEMHEGQSSRDTAVHMPVFSEVLGNMIPVMHTPNPENNGGKFKFKSHFQTWISLYLMVTTQEISLSLTSYPVS